MQDRRIESGIELLQLLENPAIVDRLVRKATEKRTKPRKRQEGAPVQWPFDKESHRFTTPCGKVIIPSAKPQGSIRIDEDWVIVKRPLECIDCMEARFDEMYERCLTFTALRNWPGWTFT